MKIKGLWPGLVSVMISANSSLAADYVVPFIVPWDYVSEVGADQAFEESPAQTYRSIWATFYT
ncbi:MAG TPA: hypothetical protein VGF13_01945, partial [Verrucomicrobiae bacterium]